MNDPIVPSEQGEVWCAVRGTDHPYEVSNLGRVRSRTMTYIDAIGRNYTKPGRVLSPGLNRAGANDGYYTVSLRVDGKPKSHRVHRLVAVAFLGQPPEPGMDVRHLDGNELNNRVENLAWGTRSENMQDRTRHGTCVNAEKTQCAKGHEYNRANTVWTTKGRQCRQCQREAGRRAYWRNLEKKRAEARERYRRKAYERAGVRVVSPT